MDKKLDKTGRIGNINWEKIMGWSTIFWCVGHFPHLWKSGSLAILIEIDLRGPQDLWIMIFRRCHDRFPEILMVSRCFKCYPGHLMGTALDCPRCLSVSGPWPRWQMVSTCALVLGAASRWETPRVVSTCFNGDLDATQIQFVHTFLPLFI